MPTLYPAIEPYDSGMLDVGEGHGLYFETCGNPRGRPAIVLHGGPGSGCNAWHRRLFDPDRYRIVLCDQRNCGRSTPHAGDADVDLRTNTTPHLVEDLERLRADLGIERWLVLGGSWGSTLALAHAERHPQRVLGLVLFGVTAGLRREFDWVFRGGLAARFPAQWNRLCEAVLPDPEAGTDVERNADVVEAVHRLLFDPDPSVRERAAFEWCLWESAIPEWPPSDTLQPRFRDPAYALAFARIVTHYVRNDAWLPDGALLDGVATLAKTPMVLIDGRHDPQTTRTAEELIRRAPHARHVVVEDASHDASNTGITAEIVRATDRLANG